MTARKSTTKNEVPYTLKTSESIEFMYMYGLSALVQLMNKRFSQIDANKYRKIIASVYPWIERFKKNIEKHRAIESSPVFGSTNDLKAQAMGKETKAEKLQRKMDTERDTKDEKCMKMFRERKAVLGNTPKESTLDTQE